uniref:Myelin basic protein n=1 Tax=Theropithecus gelada TaxID=9565 RepID=A0A8D2EQB7_THEGE
MASQKRPSQRHGSKYLATASTMDHARHGFLPRHRDTGILDSIGRFFGGDRGVPKRGSGKDSHHAARTAHYGSLPQKHTAAERTWAAERTVDIQASFVFFFCPSLTS